ncbi:glycosyltransferase [Cellulomonas fengjieae]|uniref:Glycosyltransferase family 2 protein n=1 Tax=Cellulomonas fengjieae TaxID=2819978 RepID=A0ABS3SLC0_9CELL|nr:glycosyltransferase family 2 protein [Cellulomonas fengjieae]MBO3086548.1 glycosyltransferase family 2 protein [Cellulomonas fengjieae]QVI66596.1 glycosyltransferase family 2 protein [Cellulomonas fengjieae]
MTSTGRTGVVVVNYGSHELLATNLAATVRSERGPRDDLIVVVVDSYRSDAERDQVRALAAASGWELVAPATNVGFGGGANLGVARAVELDATAVVVLNPDLAIAAGDLDTLVDRVRREPDALVAPRIVRPDGSPYALGTTDLVLHDGTMRASSRRPPGAEPDSYEEWLSGACLAFGAGLWARVGGFDEDYFLYWEDVDFSHRVLRAGGRLVVEHAATAVHDEGGTQDRRSARAKSETYYYYSIRNRMLFAARWLAPQTRRRWLRTAPTAARAVILQGGRRQLLTSVAPWRAGWRGVRDGIRLAREAGQPRRARNARTYASR